MTTLPDFDDMAPDEVAAAALKALSDSLPGAVRAIAHGSLSGPTGLELVSMAVEGPLSAALRDGLHEIAEAIRDGFEGLSR